MDFHGRLSPPEDSTKSPQWEQPCVELIFSLVLTFSIFLNSSKTFTSDHASSNFAIPELATGTSPQLSAKDAIPEEHKNISPCPPPPRHSSGRNMKQSNITSRGNMKDSFLLLTTRFSLADQAQVWSLGEGAACLQSQCSTGGSGGRMETAAPSLMLKGCCQTHWGAYPRQVKSCSPSVNTQRPNIYRNEIFPTSSLSSIFSCLTLTGNRHFCGSSKNQHPVLSTCPFSLFLASAHSKARTSRLCCVQSLPLPRHPRNQGGCFGGRLWVASIA